MARCPSCHLLLPHNAKSCSCGASQSLADHPRDLAALVGFALANLAVSYEIGRLLFSAVSR